MTDPRPFHSVFPAVALATVMTGVLTYAELAPVAGEPVAVLFRPGFDAAGALAQVAEGPWRVIRLGAVWPAVVVLMATEPRHPIVDPPHGAVLMFRAAGAAGCNLPKPVRT